ncbi:RpL29 [Drosophila busckii]|uniref:RpL29 n=1 Tax=Drosophila busckii TaxID=30019 RepID=A0A0M4EK09_DROBS|nr:RpL29 [Drosophila busckii]
MPLLTAVMAAAAVTAGAAGALLAAGPLPLLVINTWVFLLVCRFCNASSKPLPKASCSDVTGPTLVGNTVPGCGVCNRLLESNIFSKSGVLSVLLFKSGESINSGAIITRLFFADLLRSKKAGRLFGFGVELLFGV